MLCSPPRTIHTLLALVLFLSRVWSRPREPTCDGRRRLGDKWFDGCHWCVCRPSGPVCSSSECSVLVQQLPPCDNLDSVWLDGCYTCKCQPQGIECSLDPICLGLLSSGSYLQDSLPHSPQDPLSHSSCLEPFDDRCVCGVDGVPACTAEVIDKRAYSAVTVELYPILLQTQDLESQDRVIPDSILHKQLKAQHNHTSFQNDELQNIDNALSAINKSDPNVLTEQNNSSGKIKSRTRLRSSQNKFIPLQSEPLVHDINSGQIDYQEGNKVIASLKEQDVTSGLQQGSSLGSNQASKPASSSSPPLLVVSLNRCRWGARWYGGSLRCYCGHDNSVTCGDPSFVAPRIDGFRLEKGPCTEGQTWDYDSCTVCQCRISGVAFCRRAPSCPLPFLIKPALNESSSIDEHIEQKILDGLSGQQEFAGKDDNKLGWRETTALDMLPPSTNEINLATADLFTPTLDTTQAAVVDSTTSGVTKYFESIALDDIDGSGEVKLQDVLTNNLTTAFTGVHDISIGASTTSPKASAPTIEAQPSMPTSFSSTIVVTSGHLTLFETSTGRNEGLKTSPQSLTSAAPTKECKPKSRWLDGCRRCICDEAGYKHCNDSRCPQAPPPKPFTPTPNKPYVRPVQIPPDIRDHPVELNVYKPDSCGRFLPGQMFWDDCNLCLCTTIGPKCEAKNCS